MLDIFKKFSYLLEHREKTQVVGLFFLIFIGSALEMLGVGFVVPSLDPTHPVKARKMLKAGRAKVFRRYPWLHQEY